MRSHTNHRAPFLTVALAAAFGACAPVDDAPVGAAAQPQLSQPGGGGPACVFTCYRDDDGDEVGVGAALGSTYCACGAGLALVNGDCNDHDSAAVARFSCYRDGDGDHWGTGARASMCAPSSCWGSGAANNPGDLDDANANVHPERAEVQGDGLDNDQDDRVDETEFLFSTAGYNNSATGFDLHARLNASSLYNDGTLYAKVTWWALANSALTTTTAVLTVPHAAGARDVTVPVTGVAASDTGTVIAATVEWQTRVSLYGSPGVYGYLARATPSDTYYTMTSPTSTTDAADARWNIVMRALEDWDDSEKGAIHEWESDWRTTRYGVTAPATAWCTEFYATMAKDDLLSMNPLDEGALDLAKETSTTPMSNWFGQYAGMLEAMPSDGALAARAPGTWLGVDTDGDGVMNHTQMLLAWDTSRATPSFWVVQGNASGNSGARWLEGGHGQRVSVARSNATNANGTRFVHNAGRINANAMLDP